MHIGTIGGDRSANFRTYMFQSSPNMYVLSFEFWVSVIPENFNLSIHTFHVFSAFFSSYGSFVCDVQKQPSNLCPHYLGDQKKLFGRICMRPLVRACSRYQCQSHGAGWHVTLIVWDYWIQIICLIKSPSCPSKKKKSPSFDGQCRVIILHSAFLASQK